MLAYLMVHHRKSSNRRRVPAVFPKTGCGHARSPSSVAKEASHQFEHVETTKCLSVWTSEEIQTTASLLLLLG